MRVILRRISMVVIWGGLSVTASRSGAQGFGFLSFPSSNEALENSSGQKTADAAAASDMATLLLKSLPDQSKAKCVVAAIDRVMGFSIVPSVDGMDLGANNSGALLRSSHLLKASPCFASLNKIFYDRLAGEEMDHRPSLTESASAARKKPGWVWEMAKKYSSGHPRLAMALIGTCLNDDMSGTLSAPMKVSSFVMDNDEQVDRLKRRLGDAQEALASAKTEEPKRAAQDEIDALKSEIRYRGQVAAGRGEIRCPGRSSAAFLPGGLGAETDLAPAAKQALVGIYGIDAKAVPSKSYHVYAAARLGCELAACGLTEKETTLVDDQLARTYRGMRLCGQIQSLSEGSRPGRSQAAFDAAALYREGALIPELVRSGGVCSFALYQGPSAPMDPEAEIKPGFLNSLLGRNACGKKDWDSGRCEAALKKLRTWQADEIWTRSQHVRGARFGFQACHDQPAPKDFEAEACEVLKGLEASSGVVDPVQKDDGSKSKEGVQ